MRRLISLCIGLTAFAAPATAEEVVIACHFNTMVQSGEGGSASEYSKVDQIAMGVGSDYFELRIANTIGTKNETRYVFTPLTGHPCTTKIAIADANAGTIVGTQVCGPSISSFVYSPEQHTFGLSELYPKGGAISVWDCH